MAFIDLRSELVFKKFLTEVRTYHHGSEISTLSFLLRVRDGFEKYPWIKEKFPIYLDDLDKVLSDYQEKIKTRDKERAEVFPQITKIIDRFFPGQRRVTKDEEKIDITEIRQVQEDEEKTPGSNYPSSLTEIMKLIHEYQNNDKNHTEDYGEFVEQLVRVFVKAPPEIQQTILELRV